jgi:hypothetical protein
VEVVSSANNRPAGSPIIGAVTQKRPMAIAAVVMVMVRHGADRIACKRCLRETRFGRDDPVRIGKSGLSASVAIAPSSRCG